MNYLVLMVGFADIALAILSIAVAIPLVQGKIKMNRWYGIRVRKSFASAENWEKINAYGGRAFIYWSLPILLIGVAVVIVALLNPKIGAESAGWLASMVPLSAIFLLGATIQIMVWIQKFLE